MYSVVYLFIIIMITTNMTDINGLSALLGGYIGLLLGMLFVIIINLVFTKKVLTNINLVYFKFNLWYFKLNSVAEDSVNLLDMSYDVFCVQYN